MEPTNSNPAQFPDEPFDLAAYHSRQAAKYQNMFEASRARLTDSLSAPLRKRGIDTRGMPPEALLECAVRMLEVKPMRAELAAAILIASIIAGALVAALVH